MSKRQNTAITGRRNRRHHDSLYVAVYHPYDLQAKKELQEKLAASLNSPWMMVPDTITIRKATPADYKMMRIVQAKP